MPSFSRLLGLVLLITPLHSFAATVLQVPEFFEVRTINGREVSAHLLQRQRSYALTPGDTVVELRYSDVQQADLGDSHSNFRSAPVAVRFQAEADRVYVVRAQRPASERAAAAFAAAPQLTVEEADGSRPAQQFFTAEQLKKAALVASSPSAPALVPAAGGPEGLAAQNLWYWWQQADEANRQAFLKRIGR